MINVGAGFERDQPRIIRDVTWSIPVGEIAAIVGPSGGGKTTLLSTIAGLTPLFEGQVKIGRCRLDRFRPHRRHIAMMFQSASMYPHQTIGQNIFGSPGKRSESSADAAGHDRAEAYCRAAEIDGLFDRTIDEVSGGQLRRAALVRCMAAGEPIRLLDEPLTALHPSLVNDMARWIRQWHKDVDGITVCATHDFQSAMLFADRIAVIDQGRILQSGTADELAANPQHLHVVNACHLQPVSIIDVERLHWGIDRLPLGTKHVAFAAEACRPMEANVDEMATLAVGFTATRSRHLGLSLHEVDLGPTQVLASELHPADVTVDHQRWSIPLDRLWAFDIDGWRL